MEHKAKYKRQSKLQHRLKTALNARRQLDTANRPKRIITTYPVNPMPRAVIPEMEGIPDQGTSASIGNESSFNFGAEYFVGSLPAATVLQSNKNTGELLNILLRLVVKLVLQSQSGFERHKRYYFLRF